MDIAREEAVRVYEAQDAKGLTIDDPLFFLAQPDSIVLTRAFATRRGLELEDAITLETPTGRRRFVIRGLLQPTGVARAYGGNLAVMDLWAAEEVFAKAGLRHADRHRRREGRTTRRASSAAIASVLPAGLRVERPVQRKEDLSRIVRSLQLMLQGVSLVALVAAFLIAFNRLATVYEARAWQVGVLLAVGLTGRTVWWELVKEALVLGAVGVALGLPLGLLIGRIALPFVAETTAISMKLVAPEAELGVTHALAASSRRRSAWSPRSSPRRCRRGARRARGGADAPHARRRAAGAQTRRRLDRAGRGRRRARR